MAGWVVEVAARRGHLAAGCRRLLVRAVFRRGCAVPTALAQSAWHHTICVPTRHHAICTTPSVSSRLHAICVHICVSQDSTICVSTRDTTSFASCGLAFNKDAS